MMDYRGTPVMIVDDDDAIRVELTDALSHHGFETTAARSGEHALSLIESGARPAAVVTDLRLPGMSGIEFIAMLRRISACADLPCLVLTGYGSKRNAIDAMKLRAIDFLEKPVEVPDLIMSLEKILMRPREENDQEPLPGAHKIHRQIRRLFSFREEVAGAFASHLFGDHVWEILVEVVSSELAGEPISVTGAAAASGSAHATALRGIEALEREGLLGRMPDDRDRRRVWLRLTPKAREAFATFLELRTRDTCDDATRLAAWCRAKLRAVDFADKPLSALSSEENYADPPAS